MTREEASNILDDFDVNFAGHTAEEIAEAFDVAFKALSQEPKTGHWIKVTNGRGGHECDICHEYAPSYQNGDEYLTKFCPNCGAKMVEPQESEE